MKDNKGLAVIVRNEQQFKALKELLGPSIQYLDWVPQMGEKETAVIMWFDDDDIFSTGSTGSVEYQKAYGIRHVEFADHFRSYYGHIIITTIFKNRKYLAKFKMQGGRMGNVETEMGGDSVSGLIIKVGNFLGVELKEHEYTVIEK